VQRDEARRVRCVASPAPHVSPIGGDDARVELRWQGPSPLQTELTCSFAARPRPAAALLRSATLADRRWLARARPLGAGAPAWATRMYVRSLLVLRALTDRRSGAVAAGARDGWAYVWPRDAGAAALALVASGYKTEARRAARFLLGLDLDSAARFRGDGSPVDDERALPGDAAGWTRMAAEVAGVRAGLPEPGSWAGRGDYGEREGDSGYYLANAIADRVPAPRIDRLFGTDRGLVRRANDAGSGLDSAAAWAVRPFAQPALFDEARRTLDALKDPLDRFGIVPAEDWPYEEAWTAPAAWSAWSRATLDERAESLRLIRMLRRAAAPAGTLPERADPDDGLPRSTTPLVWSHAFAVLALAELYPQPSRPIRQAFGR
jgi:hypothetical protein